MYHEYPADEIMMEQESFFWGNFKQICLVK